MQGVATPTAAAEGVRDRRSGRLAHHAEHMCTALPVSQTDPQCSGRQTARMQGDPCRRLGICFQVRALVTLIDHGSPEWRVLDRDFTAWVAVVFCAASFNAHGVGLARFARMQGYSFEPVLTLSTFVLVGEPCFWCTKVLQRRAKNAYASFMTNWHASMPLSLQCALCYCTSSLVESLLLLSL